MFSGGPLPLSGKPPLILEGTHRHLHAHRRTRYESGCRRGLTGPRWGRGIRSGRLVGYESMERDGMSTGAGIDLS